MKILLLGLNYAPEPVGVAVYTTGMAEALVARGHDVRVIAGRPYYPAWKIMSGHNAWTPMRGIERGVDVIRVPHYIPARPRGAKRLLHHASFAISAFVPMLTHAVRFKPDVIVTIAPSLIAAPVARLAAALTGAKCWLHVQDFEVETAFATGLLARSRLLEAIEGAVLRSFDRVSTISPQMCRRLLIKGVEPARIGLLRNWADIGFITPMERPSTYRSEWGVNTPHVALYSGNIANKQGLEVVVAAARELEHRRDLTFLVCGDGPNRVQLEQSARGLSNIQFRPLQPKEKLGELLGLATIHLLPQKAAAADLVLPSKLANMLASGRPIVATADPGTGLASEVLDCGLVTSPGDGVAFAKAIECLMDDGVLAAKLGAAGRHRAEWHWSSAAVFDELEQELAALIDGPSLVPARS